MDRNAREQLTHQEKQKVNKFQQELRQEFGKVIRARQFVDRISKAFGLYEQDIHVTVPEDAPEAIKAARGKVINTRSSQKLATIYAILLTLNIKKPNEVFEQWLTLAHEGYHKQKQKCDKFGEKNWDIWRKMDCDYPSRYTENTLGYAVDLIRSHYSGPKAPQKSPGSTLKDFIQKRKSDSQHEL